MLQLAQKYFEISLLDQKVRCQPKSEDVLTNQQAIKLLTDLRRHKQNTMFLLSNQGQSLLTATTLVAVDIETTSLNPSDGDIRLISVFSEENQFVTEDVAQVADILKDESILKVFHNAAFDATWLTAKGYPVVNYTDTMLMGQVLHNTAKSNNSLLALAFEHLGIILDKTLQAETNWQSDITEDHKRYALKDAEVTYHLYHQLKAKIAEKHLDVVLDREVAMLPVVVLLNLNGIPFDYAGWQQELDAIEKEASSLETYITELFQIPTLNLSSHQQVKAALLSEGIELDSVTDESLAKVEHLHEVIPVLRKYKKLKKLLSTYGEKLAKHIGQDGRLRGQWRVIGTDTSRMSCKAPNLQGLPSIAKPYVKASKGNVFVIADYSTIELRILAEITKDPELIAAFQTGEDLHAKTTGAVLGKPPGQAITSEERKIGKVINFGLLYGMTAYGLQRKIQAATGQVLSKDEAEVFRNRYFELYANVLTYQNQMLQSDCIFTLGGRYWSAETTELRKGAISRFNYPIQSSGAEGVKEALKFLLPKLQEEWKLIAAVHDEIVLEVPLADANQAKEILLETMQRGMSQIIPSIPIEVDIKIESYWSK
ncbi:DNA polymerase [Metalysinibacillus jejuensis]|uniref:DNA polymerase n=1 Tax=Metalysinibacillus jejuensis TaxID=914327 RepID=UPI000D363827|nr:DNA polymerase [Metalysinibacillus jejuensis]